MCCQIREYLQPDYLRLPQNLQTLQRTICLLLAHLTVFVFRTSTLLFLPLWLLDWSLATKRSNFGRLACGGVSKVELFWLCVHILRPRP